MHLSPRRLGLLVLVLAVGVLAGRRMFDPSEPSSQLDDVAHVADAPVDEPPHSDPAEIGGNRTPAVAPPVETKTEIISFDDLNVGMPVDSVFRPFMLEFNNGRAKSLLGTKVNVGGYMNPTDSLTGVTEFILLRNLECKFGPGGQADHLVRVMMQGDLTTNFTDKIVYVEGVLELNPYPEGGASTWSIYDLKATKVSTKAPPRIR